MLHGDLNLKNNNFSLLYFLILIYILGRTSSAMAAEGKPDPEPNDQGLQAELVSLRSQAEALRQDLKACKDELQKLQKQLSQSERLQKTTESYNEDLRQQVSQVLMENRGSCFFVETRLLLLKAILMISVLPKTCQYKNIAFDLRLIN